MRGFARRQSAARDDGRSNSAVLVQFTDKPQGKELSSEQCLENARMCRDMAAYPGNRDCKSFLLEMAKSWEELAAAKGRTQAAK